MSMMRRCAAALLLTLLAACASVSQQTTSRDGGAAWQQHRVAVEAIRAFGLQGRAAGNGLGAKADLRWQQDADGRFDVRLSGPFGAGAFAIVGTAAEVEIRSKDGIETTADPETWLYRRAGWTFPIRGLRWWALGVPTPGVASQAEFDAQGRLARLQQEGWTLDYQEYQEAQGIALPRRFSASNAQISLKLVIDRWDLPAR